MSHPQQNIRHKAVSKKKNNFLIFASFVLTFSVLGWLFNTMKNLHLAATGPVDAILVLGGSIKREIYVAQLTKQHPEIPILISQGSEAPCIWLIFEEAQAPKQRVWLEQCATSTFSNFRFSSPILQQWEARKVKVITSPTHLPRAKWLAQILLGSQGMWVEFELVREEGIPGNQESWLKTTLDVTRTLIWAAIAQVYSPKCSALTPLNNVDMEQWQREGFNCEHQGNVVGNITTDHRGTEKEKYFPKCEG